MPSSIQSIVVEPEVFLFAEDAKEDLYDVCCKLDESTLMEPINSVDDVLLKDDGTRKDGLRFSRAALFQICERITPGLSALVQNIAGLRIRADSFDEVLDPRLACRIINSCAKLRFRAKEGLHTRQLIINADDGVIEGVVGPKYKYLSHRNLYETVDEMLSSLDEKVVFSSAAIHGRYMSMNWISAQSIFTVSNGDDYHMGYYFSNSEGGGTGVHAAASLTLPAAEMRCVSDFASISHAGKSFNKRLHELLSAVLITGETAIDSLRVYIESLLENRLNIFDSATRGVDRDKQKYLVAMLAGQGLDVSSSRIVVNRMLYGENSGTSDMVMHRITSMTDKSVYDLAVCVMECAKEFQPAVREKFERVAFDLITNKFSI